MSKRNVIAFTLLAKQIRNARHAKNLTQVQLAQLSKVSTKSIVSLESGKLKFRPRADVIIRLALALDTKPREWLDLSGHKSITDEGIWKIKQKSSGFLFPSEIKPSAYIETLKQKLATKQQVLLCVNFVTASGINAADVQNKILDLVNDGLWLALVVPYHNVDVDLAPDKPYLVRYYRSVHDEVLTLAHELVNHLPNDKKRQVGMFIPSKTKEIGANFVMPPLGQNALRSVLVKYCDQQDGDASYELSSWIRFSHEERDRWYKIFPKDNAPNTGVETLRTWRDYFREIIHGFSPLKNSGWDKMNGTWQQVQLFHDSKHF